MKLDVRDYRPREWFLLGDLEREREEYYLDVNCNQGAVGFSLLVKLSETERQEYHDLGRVFIDYLAAKISFSPDHYFDRDLTPGMGAAVTDTVVKFKQSRPNEKW